MPRIFPGVLRACALAIVLASGCSRSPGPVTVDRAALQAGVDSAADRLLAALRTNDPDALLALLAEDVVLMPPNEAVLKGKAAVRTWYEGFLTQMRTTSLTIGDREVLLGGEWATEIARFEWVLAPVAGGLPVTDRGSYMQVWRRGEDGRWLFSRELWNSAPPP